jgi:hypothetical protein
VQHDVVVNGGVAEQHADQLSGAALPDRLRRERDADPEEAARGLVDLFHAADDAGENEIVVDRRNRHFDALLDRDGAARSAMDRATQRT